MSRPVPAGAPAKAGGALLYRLVRLVGSIESEECRCCGLTVGQGLALLTLKPGRCVPMRKIAEELGVSPGTATRVVDNLVRDGLAERGHDPADRRRVCGRATPKGEEMIRRIEKYYGEFWHGVFRRIPRKRMDEVLRALDLLAVSAAEARNDCCGGMWRRRKGR